MLTGRIRGRYMSKVQGGKREIQKRLKQAGWEDFIICVKIGTEPRYGAVPVRGWYTATSLFGHIARTSGYKHNNSTMMIVTIMNTFLMVYYASPF